MAALETLAAKQRYFFGLSTNFIALFMVITIGTTCNCKNFDVYFPNPVVKLSVPMSISTKFEIGQFQVLAKASNTIVPDYIYNIEHIYDYNHFEVEDFTKLPITFENNTSDYSYNIDSLENNDLLKINSTTGEVFMKNDFDQETLEKDNILYLTATPKNDGFRDSVTIYIHPEAESEYCNDLEHMCFWKEAHYKLYEDIANNDAKFIPIKIGSLNALGTRNLCYDAEPKYTLETGSAYFELRNNFLYTNRKLDYEEMNVTDMNALVTCTLNLPPSLNVVPKYQKLLNITFIDLNDNGPELQQASNRYNFRLLEPYFEKGQTIGRKILFVDKDTMGANHDQTYKIFNDSMDIVKTWCNMEGSGHTGRRNTIISCQLYFTRNGILSESPYCFDLIAYDNTIDGIKWATAQICLHLEKINPLPLGVIVVAVTCPLVFIFLVAWLMLSRRNLQRRAMGKDDCTPLPHTGEEMPGNPDDSEGKIEPKNSLDPKCEFDRINLVLGSMLGDGESGIVMKGFATNIAGIAGVTTVAVKMLKNRGNSVEYKSLLNEIESLKEVSHPNVIKLLGACTKGDSPMIIIEYARYGSLRSYLRLSRNIETSGVDFTDGVEPVTVKQILSFAWQICKGMTYLTEIKLVHRDLAARNVLLADGKICKISDFGLTRDVYEDGTYLKRSQDRIPVKWIAPESLTGCVYTTKSDVWAFGVLCWELITLGGSPYPGVRPQNLYHLLESGYRMERPENCSEEVYKVVRSCWSYDPNTRPSFKSLAFEFVKLLGNNAKYIEMETNAFSNPIYCTDLVKSTKQEIQSQSDLTKLADDLGEPDNLEHLWRPPSMSYDTQDTVANSSEVSAYVLMSPAPPRKPLIETATTEQKSEKLPNYWNVPHYSVPVERGHSYVDMTGINLIPDNFQELDGEAKI